jgi:FHS family glucose/mannose:H+ symporter-like MFS transporter
LPGLQRAFDIDTGTVGFIFTAHGAGALVGIFVPSVVTSPALGARWLSAGTALLLLGAGVLCVAPTWPVTLAGAFVLAVGFGIHVIRLNSVFVAGFGSRGMAMTQLLNAAFSIGSIVGPVAIGIAGSPSMGLFGAIAGGALVLLPMCTLADRASIAMTPSSLAGDKNSATLSRKGGVLLAGFVLLMSMLVGVENSIAGWTATLGLASGFSYSGAANLTAAFFCCVFAGRLVAAGLAHRVRASVLVIAALACVVAFLSIAAFTRAAPSAFVMTGLALAPLFAATLLWLAMVLPATRHANALVIGGALLGSAVFPPLVGRVIGHFGVAAAPPAILCIAIAALITAVSIHRLHSGPR